jgi:hypothetical protein
MARRKPASTKAFAKPKANDAKMTPEAAARALPCLLILLFLLGGMSLLFYYGLKSA